MDWQSAEWSGENQNMAKVCSWNLPSTHLFSTVLRLPRVPTATRRVVPAEAVSISVNLDTPEYISIIVFYWRFHLPCFPCHRYVVLKFRLLLTTMVFLNFINLIFRCIRILTLLKDLHNRRTWDFPLNPHKTTEQDEIKSTWHGFFALALSHSLDSFLSSNFSWFSSRSELLQAYLSTDCSKCSTVSSPDLPP